MEIKDQMNNLIRLGQKPSRIISLVPSQTQFLHYLGLEEEVVGITKFCIHPKEWFETKTRVGGTKNVNVERVRALQPDFIIANKEENTLADIQLLKEIAPVYLSDVNTKEQAYDMMLTLSRIFDKEQQTQEMIDAIELRRSQLELIPFTYLYFMWKDPYFTVGPNTFIHHWIGEFGGVNVQQTERYPEYDFSQNDSPDVVFISTEPFPFSAEHIPFFETQFPSSKITIVDGEMASWYGNKMEEATSYFVDLLRLKKH